MTYKTITTGCTPILCMLLGLTLLACGGDDASSVDDEQVTRIPSSDAGSPGNAFDNGGDNDDQVGDDDEDDPGSDDGTDDSSGSTTEPGVDGGEDNSGGSDDGTGNSSETDDGPSTDPGRSSACTTMADCPADFFCLDSLCVGTCGLGGMCPDGYRCVEEPFRACVGRDVFGDGTGEERCTWFDDRCPSGQQCMFDRCVDEPDMPEPTCGRITCPADYQCLGDFCLGGDCQRDGDCGGGGTCQVLEGRRGFCTIEGGGVGFEHQCRIDADCGSGGQCFFGFCSNDRP